MKQIVGLLALLLVLGIPGSAQSLFESAVNDPPPTEGSHSGIEQAGTGAMSAPSEGRDPAPEATTIFGRAGVNLSGYVQSRYFSTEELNRVSSADASLSADLSVTPAEVLEGFASVVATAGTAPSMWLAEGWVRGRFGRLDVLTGHTILGWGRTDGISPTDVVNARAISRTAIEPDDQKQARPLVSVGGGAGHLRAELVVLPTAEFNVTPFGDTSGGDSGAGPAGFPISGAPESGDAGVAGRIALDHPVGSVSLVGAYGPSPVAGWTPQPDSHGNGGEPGPVMLDPVVHRRLVAGVNAETVILTTVVRLDAAYTHPEPDPASIGVPFRDVVYVAALERNLRASLTVTVQYVGRYVFDWTEVDPAPLLAPIENMNRLAADQVEELQHTVFGRAAADLAYSTVHLSLLGQYNLTTEEYMVQPRVEWDLSDGAELFAGLTWADGPDRTRFAQAHDQVSGLHAGFRVYF